MAECQALKRALESVDQWQEHRMADSKHHKMAFETTEESQSTSSRPKLNAIV